MKKIILILFVFILFYKISFSEWETLNIPSGNNYGLDLWSYGNYVFISISPLGLYRSSDNGTTWIQINNGLPSDSNWSGEIVAIGNELYYGLSLKNYGIYKSTNFGNNWYSISNGLPTNIRNIYGLYAGQSTLYAAITDANYNFYLYISTDFGNTWLNKNLPGQNYSINSLTELGNNIFTGVSNDIYKSTNLGNNWSICFNIPYNVGADLRFFSDGSNVYSGAKDTILFISTNSGNNWTNIGRNIPFTYSGGLCNDFKYSNGYLMVGYDAGLFVTNNNGVSWQKKTDGSYPYVFKIALNQNYIFIRTAGYKIKRRLLTEVIGIKNVNTSIPNKYYLFQNYPNPFNPSTNIRYEIKKNSIVKLIMYDLLGKEIETLVNEKQNSGTYEVTWNASKHPSGIYFYKLQTRDYSETKKMILIK